MRLLFFLLVWDVKIFRIHSKHKFLLLFNNTRRAVYYPFYQTKIRSLHAADDLNFCSNATNSLIIPPTLIHRWTDFNINIVIHESI